VSFTEAPMAIPGFWDVNLKVDMHLLSISLPVHPAAACRTLNWAIS
jgi:hypothetical protein